MAMSTFLIMIKNTVTVTNLKKIKYEPKLIGYFSTTMIFGQTEG